ncbi:hypothetical protein RND64_18010 [Gordonia sp. w5E2]|nr:MULTISPECIES: hypothetical protein [unclassified Gordonia (in: high G+C Gram-positive bacteria)]
MGTVLVLVFSSWVARRSSSRTSLAAHGSKSELPQNKLARPIIGSLVVG